jgi:hypothetical protein
MEGAMEQQPQCVFVADGEIHARQIRAFLEAVGIATAVRGESLRHTHGLTINGLGAVEILVAGADVERAHQLLDSAEAGEFRLGDDGSDDDVTPPAPAGQ